MLVNFVDEVPGAFRELRTAVLAAVPTITVRELIRARLELEVEDLRDKAAELRQTLPPMPVPLAGPDAGRHGSGGSVFMPGRGEGGRPQGAQRDIDTLIGVALAGFERGSFFVLVNDRQVTELDEALPLADATEVTFLRLTPLQGG